MKPMLLLVAVVLCLLVLVRPAGAQAGAAYEEPIPLTDRELEGFNRIFRTTEAQRAAAGALSDAARAEMKRQEAEQAKLGEAFRALPPERKTRQAKLELLDRINAAEPKVAEERRRLLGDLRTLLTPEQEVRWKKFECFLRREDWRVGYWEWEKANLIAIVDHLGLAPEARAKVDGVLDGYERELDLLLTQLKSADEAYKAAHAAVSKRELEAGRALREEHAAVVNKEEPELHHRLVLLNDSTAERIVALLPAEGVPTFRDIYLRQTLRGTYGGMDRYVREAIQELPAMKGLDDETRGALERIAREFKPADDELLPKAAEAERRWRLAMPGDAIDMGTQESPGYKRGELQGQTCKRIEDLLKPEQFQRFVETYCRRDHEWDAAMSR